MNVGFPLDMSLSLDVLCYFRIACIFLSRNITVLFLVDLPGEALSFKNFLVVLLPFLQTSIFDLPVLDYQLLFQH